MRDEETQHKLSPKTSSHLELPTSSRHTRLNGSLIPDKDRGSPGSGNEKMIKSETVGKPRRLNVGLVWIPRWVEGLCLDGASDRMMRADPSPELFFLRCDGLID